MEVKCSWSHRLLKTNNYFSEKNSKKTQISCNSYNTFKTPKTPKKFRKKQRIKDEKKDIVKVAAFIIKNIKGLPK